MTTPEDLVPDQMGRPLGVDRDVGEAPSLQRVDGPATHRAEPQHCGPLRGSVEAVPARQLQGVQYSAIPGQLVVLVEDVHLPIAVAAPQEHRLEGDQRQPPVDRRLGDLALLHAVGPSPQDSPGLQLLEIFGHGFGQDHDVARSQDLGPTRQGDAELLEPVIADSEVGAVAFFEHQIRTQRLG